MAEPLGFEHYRDNYTDEALWDMLVTQGDPVSVELSSTVWATARGKLAGAREDLNANVSDLADYWQGPASEEFQNRMLLVLQYSAAIEFHMEQAETAYLPEIAGYLASAQARARGENAFGENLNPENDITDLEEWMEQVKGLSRPEIAALTSSGWNTNVNEHAAWRKARHDELAQTVADLGVRYAEYANTVFAEPPALSPSPIELPGAPTFERPTVGVFADTPTTPSTGTNQADTSASTEAFAPASDEDEDEDEDDEVPPWTYTSLDDLDELSGGLASGGTATTLPTGGSPAGGSTISGAPALGSGFPSAGTSGTGVVPSRGPNAVNPASGAVPSNRRGTATGRGGVNPNLQTPPTTGRGGGNAPVSGRRRNDETEEEETAERESKYVEAENVFSAPFDPAAGPAHEGPKHQRAWDKEHAAWEKRRREEEE